MIWFFLIGAAFFILGGLLAVQPTKTQKRIAGLREDAMQRGLHVKLPVSLKFPDGIAKSESPYYCKNLSDRRFSHEFVHVTRRADASDNDRFGKDPSSFESILNHKLKELPSDFQAIYLGSGLIGISWNEASVTEVPEVLFDCLSDLEQTLVSRG